MSRHGLSTRYRRTGPLSRAAQAANAAEYPALFIGQVTESVSLDDLAARARAAGIAVAFDGDRLLTVEPCYWGGTHPRQTLLDTEAELQGLIRYRAECPLHGSVA